MDNQLPSLIQDLIRLKCSDKELTLKWTVFGAGSFTELKLTWSKQGETRPVSDTVRYVKKKTPSSMRRDMKRKQDFIAKKNDKLDIPPKENLVRSVNASVQTENKQDYGVTTRSKSKVEIPRYDEHDEDYTDNFTMMTPEKVDSTFNSESNKSFDLVNTSENASEYKHSDNDEDSSESEPDPDYNIICGFCDDKPQKKGTYRCMNKRCLGDEQTEGRPVICTDCFHRGAPRPCHMDHKHLIRCFTPD